ncbi:unnamed protein product [Lymnaea stagnalis]|uniref:Peptidase S1 domain-containing protein n=1 Tax=Lymnaea stagnalis TaxID=6523 RepID=A0AAV2HU58_LYMST
MADFKYYASDDLNNENYGSHEIEVSLEGESGLQEQLKRCTKNPGHTKFIPVDDFKMDHLPIKYQDEDVLQMIKSLSGLTVKLLTNAVSPARPDHYNNTRIPYPLSKYKGFINIASSGSGRVANVFKESDICKTATTVEHVWNVRVRTAAHVVFDEFEMDSVKGIVGYDSERSSTTILTGKRLRSEVCEDFSEIEFLTEDAALAGSLGGHLNSYYDSCFKIKEKFEGRAVPDKKLAVVVSHPHGAPKQVSVGEWIRMDESRSSSDFENAFIYGTSTCAGSSGGPVYIMGRMGWVAPYPHSGTHKEGNFSSVVSF